MVAIRSASRDRLYVKRAEQAYPSTTEARSAAFPACSDGFDDFDGGPECRVYIQMRSVEQVRIGGGPQGGNRPGRVALVPAQDIGQDPGLAPPGPGRRELQGAAAGALLRGRDYQNLNLRVREDRAEE